MSNETDWQHDRPTGSMADTTEETPQPAEVVDALSLAEAAELLGITTNALYLRVKRKTLPGYQEADGKWYIRRADLFTGEAPADRPVKPEPATEPEPSAPRQARPRPEPQQAVIPAYQQLEMVRDEWLQPLISQITEQATQIGRLEVQVETRDSEIARLTEQMTIQADAVAELEVTATSQASELEKLRAELAQREEVHQHETDRSQDQPTEPRSWWQRLFGG